MISEKNEIIINNILNNQNLVEEIDKKMSYLNKTKDFGMYVSKEEVKNMERVTIYDDLEFKSYIKFNFHNRCYEYHYKISNIKTGYCYGYCNNGNTCVSYAMDLFPDKHIETIKSTEKIEKETLNEINNIIRWNIIMLVISALKNA